MCQKEQRWAWLQRAESASPSFHGIQFQQFVLSFSIFWVRNSTQLLKLIALTSCPVKLMSCMCADSIRFTDFGFNTNLVSSGALRDFVFKLWETGCAANTTVWVDFGRLCRFALTFNNGGRLVQLTPHYRRRQDQMILCNWSLIFSLINCSGWLLSPMFLCPFTRPYEVQRW